MGYTTYWNQKVWSTKDRDGWNNAIPTIKKIFDKYKNIIQLNEEECVYAIANEDEIIFNGIGDDAHETFHMINCIDKFTFCKTARKPYDIVVSEVCLVMSAHCPHLKLDSDGFIMTDEYSSSIGLDGNWEEAINNVIEYGVQCYLQPSISGDLNVLSSLS